MTGNDKKKPLAVVGIGASAGGLEALENFFKNVPGNTGLTFVVVQHLSPDYKSLMAELLSKHTDMAVTRAEDGIEIEPDHVYLIPPKQNITIYNNRLFLKEQQQGQGLNLPIDIFFRSLAEDQGERAIGIVLSGTGSDGTLGSRAIKGAGGMIMVQDMDNAQFDGMPRSVIRTGLADYILHSSRMPDELMQFIKNEFHLKSSGNSFSIMEKDDTLSKILHILKEGTGVDFNTYKPNTIIRRLERRININQIETVDNYINYLSSSQKEIMTLYRELLIRVTRFFRDTEAFAILKERVIPDILETKERNEEIRVWCTGCCTGEEAYSIAILFQELMEERGEYYDVKVFATDIDKESLEYAGAGVYPESITADVSPERLARYFIRTEEGFQIAENIRKMTIFAYQNITEDPPFSRMDMISCRNLLIYLGNEVQQKILTTFEFSLVENGFLLLGSSESVGDHFPEFSIVSTKWKIYRYKGGEKTPLISNIMPILGKTSRSRIKEPGLQPGNIDQKQKNNVFFYEAYMSVINNYIPPGIIVNQNNELVHVIKNASRYIKIPEGKITYDVLSMVPGDISVSLGVAIHKSIKSNSDVVYKGFEIENENGKDLINIVVKPITQADVEAKYAAVFFEEGIVPHESDEHEIEMIHTSNYSDQRIKDLEEELTFTRENLKSTIEELEASNEELQATNEELIASNEELQSTNEELQSVNEELYTVNNEHQKKIEELIQLNNDVFNLLNNTDLGTIFLNNELKIRKYTESITKIINVMEYDIGRPIYHISFNIEFDEMFSKIEEVLNTLETFNTEVKDKDDNWYLLRIMPYRTVENAVEGVVITFYDISERIKIEQELSREKALLKRILENSPIGKTMVDKSGNVTFANARAKDILGISEDDTSNRTYSDPTWEITDENGEPIDESKLPFSIIMQTGKPVNDFVHAIVDPLKKTRKLLRINGAPMFDDNGEVAGAVFAIEILKNSNKQYHEEYS